MGVSSELERKRKEVVRKQCKVRMEVLMRCTTASLGEITEHYLEVKGGLLDLNRKGAHVYTREAFKENQELRIAIAFPDVAKIQAKALVCNSKFLPKQELYGSQILFLDMTPLDHGRLDAFLSAFE